MCYALAFLFLFGIGGLTGLFLGTLATDVHLHDTYFVVAHFHYVMMGGTLIAFLGGLHYWWPKMFGRMYNEPWARIACLIIFVGFNADVLPAVHPGQPRHATAIRPLRRNFTSFHRVSTTGAMVLGGGLFLSAGVLVHSLVRGRRAPANPWGGSTLEWKCSSPPPHHNFDWPPVVTDPYYYDNLFYDPGQQGYIEVEEVQDEPFEHEVVLFDFEI